MNELLDAATVAAAGEGEQAKGLYSAGEVMGLARSNHIPPARRWRLRCEVGPGGTRQGVGLGTGGGRAWLLGSVALGVGPPVGGGMTHGGGRQRLQEARSVCSVAEFLQTRSLGIKIF
jgi:hypothetical protein